MLEWIEEIEKEIDALKQNELGLNVTKIISRGIISANIVIPKENLDKELTDEDIEFRLVIDTFSIKLSPKLYCLTPYCFPHLADGRDLYKELRNSKNLANGASLKYLLDDILEFIKINYERGGLIFCGNYYLGGKYDLKILQKGCENIINIKENLVVNGKTIKYNRVLVLSQVYFLLFQQEKWYKNNLTLLFWASINNIEKIQKVKDNKTIILHWTTKDKISPYLMSLTINDRESFIQDLLEKMKTFGMNFDIYKLNKNNQIEHNSFSSSSKLHQDNEEKSESVNQKLLKYRKKLDFKKGKEVEKEEEEIEEEEEEEEDDENENNENIKEEKKKDDNIADNDINKNKEIKENDKNENEKNINKEENKNNLIKFEDNNIQKEDSKEKINKINDNGTKDEEKEIKEEDNKIEDK